MYNIKSTFSTYFVPKDKLEVTRKFLRLTVWRLTQEFLICIVGDSVCRCFESGQLSPISSLLTFYMEVLRSYFTILCSLTIFWKGGHQWSVWYPISFVRGFGVERGVERTCRCCFSIFFFLTSNLGRYQGTIVSLW